MEPTLAWLEDPTVFRVNRLDAHSDHVTYLDIQELAAGKTSLRQSLDGLWRFRWSENPESRPADFWKPDFDDSDFDTIQVPGHMETQGYDRIQYINKLYDWDGHAELRPPHIDWRHNPVGSYVTYFDLEETLLEHPVCISFQGVEQAMYVWLNGHFVGYSEDSFTPSEFDLSPYIHPTGNRLCVEVYKRSSAAWLEDQDFFSFSGIFRSVYLYAKTKCYVEDLWLNAGLAPDNQTGTLQLRLKFAKTAVPKVHLFLGHPKDGEIFDCDLPLEEADGFYRSRKLVLPGIRKWDHDTPELYRAILAMEDGSCTSYSIGFRRFELKDKLLLLNGERLVLNGVNRHEWSPTGGRCITQKDMDAAMEMFHANNINAVRLPLSQPDGMVRAVRQKRHLHDGRDQHGDPRLLAEGCPGRHRRGAKLECARQPPGVAGLRAGPSQLHVPAGQEPCVRSLLVLRQRELRRAGHSGHGELFPGPGPQPGCPLRGLLLV